MKYFIFFFIVIIAACNHSPKKVNVEFTEAKSIHHNVAILQHQKPLKRTDNATCASEMFTNAYQHPVTFGAYFFYNFPLALLKDMSILIAAPVAEATNVCLQEPRNRLNDSLDEGYEKGHYISYPEMHRSFWGYGTKANYMNMDDYDVKNLDYYTAKNN